MNKINSSFSLTGFLETRQGGRTENLDCIGYADTPLGFLMVVCDGLSTAAAGHQASTTVATSVIRFVGGLMDTDDHQTVMREAVKVADNTIKSLKEENPALEGISSTIACLLFDARSAVIAHVGHTRLYQLRSNKVIYSTADASNNDLAIRPNFGEPVIANQSTVSRVLSGTGTVEPEVVEVGYKKGDRFMICTDGIWTSMPEIKLIQQITQTKNLSSAVAQMAFDVDEIGKAKGDNHDSLTLAIIETTQSSKKKAKSGSVQMTGATPGNPLPISGGQQKIPVMLIILAIVAVLCVGTCIFLWASSGDDEDAPAKEAEMEQVDQQEAESPLPQADENTEEESAPASGTPEAAPAPAPEAPSGPVANPTPTTTAAPAPAPTTTAAPAPVATPAPAPAPAANNPYKIQINDLERFSGLCTEDKFITEKDLKSQIDKIRAKKGPEAACKQIQEAINALQKKGTERTATQKAKLQQAANILKQAK